MKFSVLMSIYYKEKAKYFDRAMQSIWDEQILKPNEIILVEDGKLTDELYEAIDKWKSILGDIFITIPLKENVGTGKAKNIGLLKCKYDFVAIMDTDDISLPNRFKNQIEFLKNNPDIDVVGSWVGEFADREDRVISYRKVLQNSEELHEYAKRRMPMNHPSTFYRKKLALDVGGYKDMIGFEDYYLFVRMMIKGGKFYNFQEPLLNMRAGYGQLERRGGLNYIKNEFRFQVQLLKLGFINIVQFFQNIILRSLVRTMPQRLRGLIYNVIRKKF